MATTEQKVFSPLAAQSANSGASAANASTNAGAIQQTLQAQTRVKAGASWFYWIAALSLINTVIVLSGSQWHFILGLGITQVVDALARKAGSVAYLPAVIIDLVVASLFVFFGIFASKPKKWAFVIGMAIYAFDCLLFVLGRDILGIGFHCFALYQIYRGMVAMAKLPKAQTAGVMSSSFGK
jgi:flagellar biosynthesis protein FliP